MGVKLYFVLIIYSVSLIFFSGASVQAAAEPDEDLVPAIVAIQTRPYFLKNEFSAHVGYFPLDQFHHYQASGGAYSRYLRCAINWDMFRQDRFQNMDFLVFLMRIIFQQITAGKL